MSGEDSPEVCRIVYNRAHAGWSINECGGQYRNLPQLTIGLTRDPPPRPGQVCDRCGVLRMAPEVSDD